MSTKRIDAHQHFWNYEPVAFSWLNEDMKTLRRDFLPSDLRPLLRSYGMDGTIAVQARQCEEETQFLLDLAEKNEDVIMGVVGWVDLRAENVEDRLAFWSKNKKLVGMRHIVQDEPDDEFLLRPDFLRGVALLKKYDLTYDILIYPKQLKAAAKFVALFPEQPFVVDHIAKPFIKDHIVGEWENGIRALAAFPNVYVKVSGMVTEADWKNWKEEDFTAYLDIIFDAFGTKRVMIGSDWPMMTLCGEYAQVLDIVKRYIARFSQEEQDMILGGNADHFYLHRCHFAI
ncbi:amidohydrolase family protein [Blastocystis sp. ATCC 50177/Nand II]|uniref:Amidohydrolase family protein n=1 Tax=Blastocystis sp. subtype 1 (strain ATCC 50177 / NandII) TaxID=478820 RepID=A0A196S909_BLAHN|nr:amidohydrolase family protein [Blastocystis sp. ATCC 50177/Nand II]